MTDLHAKPIIDNKFWIVEKDGEKFATLRKDEDNRFILSNLNGVKIYDKKMLTKEFGKEFFVAKIVKEADNSNTNEVHGYPCSSVPHNSLFDVKRKLPLFTKSEKSKSLYCAGHFLVKFEKGWVKGFCPKLITIQRYPYQGPFKTDLEARLALKNANR
jgi:hypothetical protein